MVEFVEEIGSTNSELMRRATNGEPLPDWLTLCTYRQTAGRGQRGNGWESEPDKNISFTTVLPTCSMPAEQLPRLSMVVPLAVAEALRSFGLAAEIKWPNDIYVGDLKICGILIENVLKGATIACSLAGIGVNINQRVFISNAPNPSSMALLTGMEHDKEEVLRAILARLEALWPLVNENENHNHNHNENHNHNHNHNENENENENHNENDALKEQYMGRLYRREGVWQWRERTSSAAPVMIDKSTENSFEAEIADVNRNGQLVLRQKDGSTKAYNFKEIQYII